MPYTFQQLTITDIDDTAPRPAVEPAEGRSGPGAVAGRPVGEGPVLRRSVQLSPALRCQLRTTAAALGVPASVVARRAIDALVDRSDTIIARSPAEDTATRTARLTIAAPVWWWSRFRTAAAQADVAQHEVVHAALTAAFARR